MILQDYHFGPDGNLLPQYQSDFQSSFDPAKAVPEPVLSPQLPQGVPQTPNPVLNTGVAPQTATPPPVLTAVPSSTTPPAPQQQTGNKRDATALSVPRQKMSLGEVMGRYGGAIMNAGSQGGMAQVGAMGTVTGQIADKEREMERYVYEQENANRLAAEEAKIRQADAYGKAIQDQQAGIMELDSLDSRFAQALAKFDIHDNVTGVTPGDAFARLTDWAGLNDSSREAFRLELKQLIVDETLMSTAKTKGAISDKEMALFQSGIPNINADEDTWRAWLTERRKWLAETKNRMARGIRVAPDADIGFSGYTPPATSQQQQQPSQVYSPEDQAIIDKYTTPTP